MIPWGRNALWPASGAMLKRRSQLNTFEATVQRLLAPNTAQNDQQHEQIVIAILTGRPDTAAKAMREHLSGTALLLRGFLD